MNGIGRSSPIPEDQEKSRLLKQIRKKRSDIVELIKDFTPGDAEHVEKSQRSGREDYPKG